MCNSMGTGFAKAVILLLAITALVVACASEVSEGGTDVDQRLGTAADSLAIMNAISNWERAWEIYDADLAAAAYSSGADFTNAFGMRRVGRDSIAALLARVFQVPTVTPGKTQYEYHSLIFLSPTVATLRSRALREGQQLADGTPEIRHINHLRVFVSGSDGWEIVSHLISDERAPGAAR